MNFNTNFLFIYRVSKKMFIKEITLKMGGFDQWDKKIAIFGFWSMLERLGKLLGLTNHTSLLMYNF